MFFNKLSIIPFGLLYEFTLKSEIPYFSSTTLAITFHTFVFLQINKWSISTTVDENFWPKLNCFDSLNGVIFFIVFVLLETFDDENWLWFDFVDEWLKSVINDDES